MRTTQIALAFVASLILPAGMAAQGLEDIMEGIRNGGGWVSIPIVAGTGEISTALLPTLGLTLNGCVRVWDGHSGRWVIRARDTIAEISLETDSAPGEGVRFSHRFGVRSQMELEFQWSEPRDTTLILWVGLETLDDERDPCAPPS